jgi:pilus assembly protein CpaC
MKSLKNLILFLSVLILAFASSIVFSQSTDEYLIVNVPKLKSFNYAIGNVTVGSPDICDFRANRKTNQITLYPKKAGETLLMVYDANGKQRNAIQLSVYPTDPERLLSQIRKLLMNIEGISINRMDQKIVIDGEVYTQEDKERIKKVIGDADNIIDLSTLNSNTERIIAKKIEKEINLDEVSVRALKGKFILEGEVYSKPAKERAEAIARLYSDKVINVLEIREVPKPPSRANTIQVTAHFIEISKNFTKNLNLKFNPFPNIAATGSLSYNPVTSSNTWAGTLSGTINDILPKINYYKALGIARVIENPTISVKSGATATISSGTKIGFPIVSAQGSVGIEFQNVGITLEISPYAQGSDIDMQLQVKVSALGSPDIQGSVAIDESNIKTQQFVRSGESIVVGGMIRYNVRNIVDRPPPTASVSTGASAGGQQQASDPFALGSLFTLFKSTDYGKQRSQFIIFITPTILKYAKDANQELKEQFNLYEVYPSGAYKPMSDTGE